MKNKVLFLLKICVALAIPFSYFLPIDFIWWLLVSFIAGLIDIVLIIIEISRAENDSSVKKKSYKLLIIIQIFCVAMYILLFFKGDGYWHIAWNFDFFILTMAVIAHLLIDLYSRKVSQTKILIFFTVLTTFTFAKSFFFTNHFYFVQTSEEGIADIRFWKKEGYYKSIGKRKLLRKNPAPITSEECELIAYLFNSTPWLEENYPEYVEEETVVDYTYIEKNIY